jgi:hypothetical protein
MKRQNSNGQILICGQTTGVRQGRIQDFKLGGERT